MASETDDKQSPPVTALHVDIDAVALWEPMPHAQKEAKGAKGPKKVAGLSIESWDFRPQRHASESDVEIVVSQAATSYTLDDGTQTLIGNELEWRVAGRYVETREFQDGDNAPRPKHFFALKVPKGLALRLRQSPAEILAQSDLFEATDPKSDRGSQ
jgi:hypothetical protein